MRTFIDGDACPNVREIISLCEKYQVPVLLICDDSHEFIGIEENIEIVSTGFQSADMVLLNYLQEHDFVITQDYGVAVIALSKKCMVMNLKGDLYTNDNIDALLYQRHISSKIRKSGGHTKGPKKRTEKDKELFLNAIEEILKRNV